MNDSHQQFFDGRRLGLICSLLFVVVACVFLPTLRHDFFDCDDDTMVTKNLHVQSGLSWATLQWSLTETASSNWHPVTWMSHALDCQLYGLKPWGHHLTSVLFHALNAVLLFLLLRRMTGSNWRSLFVAAIFGLHPLRVESVAWVSERKDVLSTAFWLLTTWAYVRYVEERRKSQDASPGRFYGLTLLFLALGLMSKPMLVTLPCVLLLLDYWPLNRLSAERAPAQPAPGCFKQALGLVIEKVPFFVLAAAASSVTFFAQKGTDAVMPLSALPMNARVANALVSCWRYLGKLVWPQGLAIPYPLRPSWPATTVALAGIALAGVTVAAIWLRRRQPYLLVGWLWFLGTLVPVIGLIQVGSQAMADRYTYIPGIGVLIALTWALHSLSAKWRSLSNLLPAAGALAVLSCAAVTSQQLSYWETTETVYRHSIEVTEDNTVAYTGLAGTLCDNGRFEEAVPFFQRAIETSPGFTLARRSYGGCLQRLGRIDEALVQLREALRQDPNSATSHLNLGVALEEKGLQQEAAQEFEQARKLAPVDAGAENNLGVMMAKSGRLDQAISHFQQAVGLNPKDASAHLNLGLAWFQTGFREKAIDQYRKTLVLQPDNALAHASLAAALRDQGQPEESLTHYREVLRLVPSHFDAAYEAGLILLKLNRQDEAIASFKQVLTLQPNHPQATEQLRALNAKTVQP